METLEKIEVYYSLGNENTDYDLIDKNHIRDLIVDRFEKQKYKIEGKYLYSLNLQLTLTRENYDTFSMEKLQSISRKLTNGMSSFGGVTYRQLFNNNFFLFCRFRFLFNEALFFPPEYTGQVTVAFKIFLSRSS